MKCFSLKHYMHKSSTLSLIARVLLCIGLFHNYSCLAAEKPKRSVADLRYGVALYHYYQQDYLASLSELMVADARDGIHGHGDNPTLINGGISLAFGMQNHAEKIFTQVLEDNKHPQSVRDAAWFYLGKLQYARSDFPAAEQSFSRVSNTFNRDLLAEMRALQINLQIKKNQFDAFTIKQVEQQQLGDWSAYALYNLGAAHAREGNMRLAQNFLRELESMPIDEDNKKARNEYYALLDKAYTAIGYSLLQEKSYISATQEFNKVRLDGIESNQALLGYGWSAMAQEKYKDAIKPWQVLQKRSLLNPAAQEALLALPFAYEKLNASGDALHEYEHAEELFGAEIQLVKGMRANLTRDELLKLVSSKPASVDDVKNADTSKVTAQIVDDGQNWLKLNDISVVKTRSMYLRELFARNEFQSQVLELRDLLKLQTMLKEWQPKLTAYTELLQQKQVLRQQQKVQSAQQSLVKTENDLEEKRGALLARLTTIKTNNDYMALADDATRSTYVAIERSETTIRQMKAAGQDTSEYDDRLHILRGLLLWRAAQQFSAGIADNEVVIDQTDKALARIAESYQKIKEVNATGSDLQPMLSRIQQQQKQLQEQLSLVDSAINARGEQLRQQVDKQLDGHEKRLNRYLAQSHLAIARLYDNALRKQAP